MNTQKVNSPFQRSPFQKDSVLKRGKWFSFCATGDFETIIDWIFVRDYITMTRAVRLVVLNLVISGCQGLHASIIEEEEG